VKRVFQVFKESVVVHRWGTTTENARLENAERKLHNRLIQGCSQVLSLANMLH